MRVRVILTVDVDPEEWAAEYGVTGAALLRPDVRGDVHQAVRDRLIGGGLAHEVHLRLPARRVTPPVPTP